MPGNASMFSPSELAALTPARFREMAVARLLPSPPPAELALRSSDFDLNPADRPLERAGLRAAAVLIPVLHDSGMNVLLTQRTPHLTAHAGQIAFPGGKIEPSDKGPLDAALREAKEEIGLDPRFVEPLGYVEPYETGTGYLVTPVVAEVHPGFTLVPDPQEVAAIFEVPLTFLLDEANHRIDQRQWRGAERRYYAIPHEDRYIWGATAGIIRALARRLAAS